MIDFFRDLHEGLREQFYAHQTEAWAILVAVTILAIAVGYGTSKRDQKANER